MLEIQFVCSCICDYVTLYKSIRQDLYAKEKQKGKSNLILLMNKLEWLLKVHEIQ
jgi:hypothetical protein